MDAAKLNKLPKWAQEEFRLTEMRAAEKERLITRLTEAESVDYNDLDPGKAYMSIRGDKGYREVDIRTRVIFPSEVGYIEVRSSDGTDVTVSANGGWSDMQVRPHVSNVITVRAAARS